MSETFSTSKGKYIRLELLGKGGFGEVWKVKHETSGKVFAVKTFMMNIDGGDAKKELDILKKVGSHQNIVELIDSGKNFIVLEFCDLGDLDHYIRRNPSAQVKPMMKDMIQGLCFLHGKDLAHRDLKPANILLCSTGGRAICKIADFGLSRYVDETQQESSFIGFYMSTYCGTPYYMAPEVGEREYKKACDVFSLGAIFFVLFSKQTRGNGDGTFLAPTVEDSPLSDVTDNQISSALQKLDVKPKRFRDMISSMLKHDYKERVKIDEVYARYC